MKLKKIVSLALAGVLAVSMLAGCKSTGAADSSASSEAPAATGLTGKVIAGLDLDNVTFSTDDALQASLEVLVANTAKNSLTSLTGAGSSLVTVNSNLGTATALPKVTASNCDDDIDGVKQTYVFLVNTQGTDEEFVVNQLVSKIEAADVADTSATITLAGLPEKSEPDDGVPATYQYQFKYTASVATTSAVDNNGNVTYVAAVVLTRTPFKAEYKG